MNEKSLDPAARARYLGQLRTGNFFCPPTAYQNCHEIIHCK